MKNFIGYFIFDIETFFLQSKYKMSIKQKIDKIKKYRQNKLNYVTIQYINNSN